jgi:hypothetical protein
MQKGLKPHTHEKRAEVIEILIPQIKKRFSNNLVALASSASFARNDDGRYSDLELTAFLKKLTAKEKGKGISVIHDGMLIELTWTTKEKYLEEVKKVNLNWYLSGSDVMKPLINEKFINELSNLLQNSSNEEYISTVEAFWPEVQESTSKVLKAIERDDLDALCLVYWDMVKNILIVHSFLNHRPYTTFAKMISESRSFSKKIKNLQLLLNPMKTGFGELTELEKLVLKTFSQIESLALRSGAKLYSKKLKLFSK